MLLKMARRLLLETDKRLLWKLAWNMGWKGMLSVERHKRRLKRGEYFPPFLYVSIINSCNLRCQGCWVDVAAKQETIKPAAFHKLVRDGRAVNVVPRLPADGARGQPAAVPDAPAAAAGAEVRRRDAGQEADHHRGRLLRRRGPGPVPGGDRHQPPHQPLGRHRAVPDR